MDLDPHRILGPTLYASVGGALVAGFIDLKSAPGTTRVERWLNVMSGAACAWWLAPASVHLFGLTGDSAESAMAFVIGMFGMSIVAAVMQAIRTVRLAEIITGWISRK